MDPRLNFGLAGEHACVRREDISILLLLFCCVELVRIYNAGKTISVNISSSLLYYCSPFFTERINLLDWGFKVEGDRPPAILFPGRVNRHFCFAWSVNEDLFFQWFVNLHFSVLGKLVFHFFVIREICNLHVICEPTILREKIFTFLDKAR